MIKRVTGGLVAVAITVALTATGCNTASDDCDSMGTNSGIELAGFKPKPRSGSLFKSRPRTRSHGSSHGTHHSHHHSHGWDDDDCDD
jgi:hypothetical protein